MIDKMCLAGPLLAAAWVLSGSAAYAQALGGTGPAKPDRPDPSAPNDGGFQVAYSAAVASDYVNRGVSQTSGDPQQEAGVEAGIKGFYAGATTYHVDFRHAGNRASNAEVDLYGGYSKHVAGQTFDVGVIGYLYTPQPRNTPNVDYAEIYAKTARPIGPFTLSGSIYYTDNGSLNTGRSVYGVVTTHWKVTKTITASALFGRQTVQAGGGYDDWNAGANYAFTDHVKLDLRYWNTSRHDLGLDYRERLVASLLFSF